MSKDTYNLNKNLFGHRKHYKEIFNLLNTKNFNNPILLTGNKGIGKFTLVQHLISKICDEDNYDNDLYSIKEDNFFFSSVKNSISDNFVYLSGEDENIKIDKIRKLRIDLTKSTINNKRRYIILDDIDRFNINCSNALLKAIEEPSKINQFILINNKSRAMLETITSRCIEIKIFINNTERDQIIENLIKIHAIDNKINYKDTSLSPGNFLLFNEICLNKKIDLKENLNDNLIKLISFFKLYKEVKYLNLLIFLIDQYYYNISKNTSVDLYSKRISTIKKIHDFNNLNLNNINVIKEIEKNL